MITKAILNKRNTDRDVNTFVFKIYYRAISIKEHCGTGTKLDTQVSITEGLEASSHI